MGLIWLVTDTQDMPVGGGVSVNTTLLVQLTFSRQTVTLRKWSLESGWVHQAEKINKGQREMFLSK